jgi:hypothetical protein
LSTVDASGIEREGATPMTLDRLCPLLACLGMVSCAVPTKGPVSATDSTVLVRPEEKTDGIPAGALDTTSGLGDLTYVAKVDIVDSMIRASVSIANRSRAPISVDYGACALSLRAYRNPWRTGAPAWRSELRAPWNGFGGYACPGYRARRTLAPGETFSPREFQFSGPLIELLGDSLPDGRYWFAATLRLNRRNVPEFPAGSADLAMARLALPSSQTVHDVRYEARSELVRDTTAAQPPMVLAVVTASKSQGGALLRYSAACPVVLYLYRDRGRRDAAPRSGTADWTSHDACGAALQQLSLYAGETHTFQVQASTRDLVEAGLQPGRYYVAVAVLGERRKLYLSAGEMTLAR